MACNGITLTPNFVNIGQMVWKMQMDYTHTHKKTDTDRTVISETYIQEAKQEVWKGEAINLPEIKSRFVP
jgi:hypothetical protein